jgi:epoxyqueuosine reductase
MTEPFFTRKIKDTALGMNADFIGIADPACFLNPEYAGNKPQDVMPA